MVLVALTTFLWALPTAAQAARDNGGIGGNTGDQSLVTWGFTSPAQSNQTSSASQLAVGVRPSEWYEYVTVPNCDGNSADNVNTEFCRQAATYCSDNGLGDSLWHRVYQRLVTPEGVVGDWLAAGTTCFPDALPTEAAPAAPVLTLAQVVEQFHNTSFALPQTVMQPPGGVTLVNLPTFYELEWPADGIEPAEIDTTTLVGFNVRIRPTFVSATYNFGDGNSSGPVESLGGTWPDGDIQHTYTSKSEVSPSISVVYGGEYSVDGDEWQDIPDTATVDGPSQPLEIVTSRNRLVSDANS